MKHPSILGLFAALAAALTCASAATSEPAPTANVTWLTDPTDAIMRAAADESDAVIWFSREESPPVTVDTSGTGGPAWCRLSYPERSFERPDEAQWFIAWADRFATTTIPSVVAVDGQGRPFAQIQGNPGPTTRQAIADARHARDAALTAADASTGIDRARRLDAALQAVGPYAVRDYRPWAEEVVALDPDNVAGLRDRYAPQLAETTIDEVIQGEVYPLIDGGSYADARRRLEQLQASVPGLSAEQRQTLTAFRAQLLITEGNPADARTLLTEALALAPQSDTATQIRSALTQAP